VYDVGTIKASSGMRLGAKLTGIDTPTLKGLWQTAPYLHDGRAATLTEIFTKHLTQDQMGKTSGLTSKELAELVEYLLELDDVPEPLSPPQVVAVAQGEPSCSVGPLSRTKGRGSLVEGLFAYVVVVALIGRKTRSLDG
jgi:hypothetical protein